MEEKKKFDVKCGSCGNTFPITVEMGKPDTRTAPPAEVQRTCPVCGSVNTIPIAGAGNTDSTLRGDTGKNK